MSVIAEMSDAELTAVRKQVSDPVAGSSPSVCCSRFWEWLLSRCRFSPQ
jgi:hypothetical protein